MDIRIKEHHRNVRNQEIEKSAVALHVKETGHRFKENGELIVKCNDRNRLNILESIEMFKNKEKLVNVELDRLKNPLLKLLEFGNNGKWNVNKDEDAEEGKSVGKSTEEGVSDSETRLR